MKINRWTKDRITLVILAGLLLGCYATTHRGPRTLDPGQLSGSGGYLHFKGADAEPDDEPGELITMEGRIGVAKGLDVGYMRTIDISKEVDEPEEGIDTHWFDAKLQLLNRENLPSKPTIALGYGFGKIINEEDLWVQTLYFLCGTELERTSLFYSFRYETFDEEINWIPKWAWEEEFVDIRKAHILGLEFEATPIIRPVVEIGRFYTGDFTDGLNVFTVGVNLYAPRLK